jgi:hypothetical protein
MTHQAFAEVSTHAHQIRAGSVQETKLRDDNDCHLVFWTAAVYSRNVGGCFVRQINP